MKLLDLVHRPPVPEPWAEGDNIPWHDPEFSARMLQEHLTQAHDAASRRFPKIERQVAWIHHQLLGDEPAKVLDLGCGPGLYTSRLAALGHECVGIDYSPAAIAYAREQARRERLTCTYQLEDIREAEYGRRYKLVMLLYGEFNVFRPQDARRILNKAYHTLAEGGQLLLEPHTYEAVQSMGRAPAVWRSHTSGLFAACPHLYLIENHWNAEREAATRRYYIVEAATGEVTPYAQSFQAYTQEGYCAILGECGFEEVQFYPSLIGVEDASQTAFLALVARKNG